MTVQQIVWLFVVAAVGTLIFVASTGADGDEDATHFRDDQR